MIGDDEDNAIDGRQDFFRPADRSSDGTRGLLPITLQDPPDSTTLRIEGTVELFLADGEETRLIAPPLAYGEEKTISYGSAELTFSNRMAATADKIRRMAEKDGTSPIRSITYQLADKGAVKEIEWVSASGESLDVIVRGFMSEGDDQFRMDIVRAIPGEETFQARVTLYKNPTEEKLPVRFRLDLSTMQVISESPQEN